MKFNVTRKRVENSKLSKINFFSKINFLNQFTTKFTMKFNVTRKRVDSS